MKCAIHLFLFLIRIIKEALSLQSIDSFYTTQINKFTNSNLELSQGDYGYELKCKRAYQPEENVMMIQWNDTISSFDTHYHPYNTVIGTILSNKSLSLSDIDIQLINLIVNINYLAYVEPKPSDIKDYLLYQLNLDDYYFDYLPYWNSNLKLLLKKVSGSPIIEKDLFSYNDTILFSVLSSIKSKIHNTLQQHQEQHFLSIQSIKASINLILSKSFVFSLKAYKIISHSPNVTESDLDVKGYILIPGADLINHKKLSSASKNVIQTQIKYERGSIIIKAGSTFSIGDPFTINYDLFQSLEHFMKTYGFVPIDSLHDNMVFSSSYFNVSTDIVSRICYVLSACLLSTNQKNIIQVVQYTNQPSFGKMTLHRLNNWQEEPLIKRKMIEVYEKLRLMTHLNSTEGMAMSEYGKEYYGTILYKANFQIPIELLLDMYSQNEKGEDVGDIVNQYNLKGYKFNSSYDDYILKRNVGDKGAQRNELKYKRNLQRKFREIIKYCLVEHHVIALNMGESIERLNKTIDNLVNELEKEIINFFE